jgi:hypothetical protein
MYTETWRSAQELMQDNINLLVLNLYRVQSDSKGTLGILKLTNELICYTLELPYLNNQRNISCIPAGEYNCVRVKSPRFGDVFEVVNVKGRSNILIHKGNWITDIQGCILVGLQQSIYDNNLNRYSVLNSTGAFNKLNLLLAKENSFKLNIEVIS